MPAGRTRRASSANKACAAQPGEPMLHHLLAAVLFSKGEIQPARSHIETSLAKRPGNAAAHLLAARIARAAGGFRRRAVASGSRDRDRAAAGSLSRKGADAGPGRSQSRRRARRGGRSWKSIPQHQEAAARLGRLAWEDGDHAVAATHARTRGGERAPASVWFDLGVVRQDLRDHDGAATAYRKALEIKPDYAEAALNLGIVLQEAGDLDSAMRAYAQAYRLRPQTFGTIAMALTSASHGRLWLDEAALRRSLGG